jgi:signal transduction histidine kinase
MSLTNRFSALMLAVLGLTLAGFSAALLVSTRIYLDRQVDERLSAILTLLSTSVDCKPGWVRWEPRSKRLPASHWNRRHATTWLVADGHGRLLTCPENPPERPWARAWAARAGYGSLPDRVEDSQGRWWRVARRRFRPTVGRIPPEERPRDTPDGKSYHDEVVLAAFGSLDEAETVQATLGGFLAGVSTLVWGLAALGARWLSRKTLAPLTRLVESARGLDAANPGWTLPELGTRDELDELRRAFNDLLARLREAYDRQRRFSSDASHQLRTPVAVMSGHLELALRRERSGEEYRRVIRLAHGRAVELGRLVESLLFLSRADAGTLTHLEPIDLARWLALYLPGRPRDLRSADITIGGIPSTPLWIKAQPHLLAQMLENLLDNACKYSRPGTPIVVATARKGGSARLLVEDSGRGIAPEDLLRIFEPFFRASPASGDPLPGVGLGLSVVERIARAFGGTVRAESEPGRGSRFEVLLPLAAASDADFDGDPGPEPAEASATTPA